jgi:hypothetical protein
MTASSKLQDLQVDPYALCDCPANGDPAQIHWWTCSSAPIGRDLNTEQPISDAINEIIAANLSVFQSVIKCAICGRENLGKNMDVVYQAPGPRQTKSTKTMLKAICPSHNRKGTIRPVMVRGY